jgi:N utilization substance protein A
VGQKGVRVQAVITELGGNEKVDIIQWSEDIRQFIIAALAPAKDAEVVLDENLKTAIVTVPDDQLSLAIGRDGQNVRLAAKVTGWKIDIRGKNTAQDLTQSESEEDKTKKSEVKNEEPVVSE